MTDNTTLQQASAHAGSEVTVDSQAGESYAGQQTGLGADMAHADP